MDQEYPENRQFYTSSELREDGFSYYKINRMVEDGRLERLTRSTYRNTSYKGDESDFSIATVYAPKGVICMLSAARYYNLTTFLPDSVDIAIERSMKVSTVPEWPSLNIWYFPKVRYETGAVSEGDFRIYEVEKTVADILYYRNKIGIEETREILKNYLARKERNLVRLHRFADLLGCGKILSTYMEVLL
ncbi:MAG TPA: hypothetical protein DCP98_01215 [Sphaerochaeta sp.]|jgi:predicted transcriptional regulator of viral defense system|nr:hypothetical protein [Sphaerochaeta sp.]